MANQLSNENQELIKEVDKLKTDQKKYYRSAYC